MWKELFSIFAAFFRVGILTFGGGYSMLPMLRREVVEKHKWASEEELLDWFAMSQCAPGAIAISTATFAGRKIRGFGGAVAAALGVVMPSLLIILIVALFLQELSRYAWVKAAFAGIRAGVCALILNAVVKLWKKAVKDRFALLIFILALLGAVFLDVSPVLFVLLGALAGFVWLTLREKRVQKGKGE